MFICECFARGELVVEFLVLLMYTCKFNIDKMIFRVTVAINMPINNVWNSHSSFSPGVSICRLFNNSKSDVCDIVSHCSFNLHCLEDKWVYPCLLANNEWVIGAPFPWIYCPFPFFFLIGCISSYFCLALVCPGFQSFISHMLCKCLIYIYSLLLSIDFNTTKFL